MGGKAGIISPHRNTALTEKKTTPKDYIPWLILTQNFADVKSSLSKLELIFLFLTLQILRTNNDIQ